LEGKKNRRELNLALSWKREKYNFVKRRAGEYGFGQNESP
jgi:hypothetical protein